MAYEIKVEYSGGDGKIPTVTVSIKEVGVDDPKTFTDAATSESGPVDAICKVVQKALGIQMKFQGFFTPPIGSDSNADGEVIVQIECDGTIYVGSAKHDDPIIAIARAIADALDKYETFVKNVVAVHSI